MSRPKAVLVFVLFFLLFLSAGIGYATYHYMTAQAAKIKNKEAEIETLKQNEILLSKRIQDAEEAGRQVLEQNNSLKQSMEKFESEKAVILNQVKSSVASFESFRTQATDEINRLNTNLTDLQNEKKQLTEKLADTEESSQSRRAELEGQIAQLNQRIEDHQKMETTLTENLKSKEKVSMVVETAKLHYNLGNFYFKQANFKNAAREYTKALFYLPEDADANFNLAVVSDEYLDDRATAIAHYRRYLELNPEARDAQKIKERILDLEIEEKIYMDDPLALEKKIKSEENIFDPAKARTVSFQLRGDKR